MQAHARILQFNVYLYDKMFNIIFNIAPKNVEGHFTFFFISVNIRTRSINKIGRKALGSFSCVPVAKREMFLMVKK